MMIRRATIAAMTTALLAASAAAAAPHAPEAPANKALWAAVARAEPGALALLAALVDIDTGTGDRAGWARALALIEPRLKAIGMTIEHSPAERPDPPDNVVARLQGTGHGRILIIAHIDTVFEAGTAAARPFRVDGTTAKGPGVSDEKGGLVTALTALELLHAAGQRDFAAITLLIDSSEEKGSMGSQKLIDRLARAHDVALNMEPAQDPDGVVVWRKGSGTYNIEVRGRAAHAGVAPQDGRNAAVELLHQLEPLDGFPHSGDGLTVNLTVLAAGGRTNIIPDLAVAKLNVRGRTKADFDKVEAALKATAAHPKIADTIVSVSFDRSFPPLPQNPATDALAVQAQAIYAELGLALGTGGNGGGSESAIVHEAGTPVLDGLGPLGRGFHSDAEALDLTTVRPRLYLMTRLLIALGKKPPGTKPD